MSQSLLIVLTGSLGDVVRGLVLPHQIKTQRPDWRITWLVDPKWAGVVKLNRWIDEVIVFDRPRGLSGALALRQELKRRKFEITLDLQRIFKSGVFSFWSGARRRIGFHRGDAKEFNWLFNSETIGFVGNEVNKMLHYLEFLKPLGLKRIDPLDSGLVSILNVSLPELIKNVRPRAAVCLVLGSSWPSKDWLPEGYEGLIERLRQKCPVVLAGDKSQLGLAERLRTKFPDAVIDTVGKTSLLELVRIISHMRAAVGPDSGPGHIAAALGVPYVSIFGPTAPERVAPFGQEELVVKANLGCMPCLRRECPGLGKLCMRLVTVEQVWGRLSPLI